MASERFDALDAALRSLLAHPQVRRGSLLALAIGDSAVGLAVDGASWSFERETLRAVVERIESTVRPRWAWWSSDVPALLASSGVRAATCWDVAAVHRLLAGGWKAEPARVWAWLHSLDVATIPAMGQLGLLDDAGDEGTDPEDPCRPDGHLRPEWTAGGWTATPMRTERWATTALQAIALQQQRLASLPPGHGADATARSESAAEMLCAELTLDGLPIDIARAEAIIESSVGPRPRDEADAERLRAERDALVLAHVPPGVGRDLRNAAHVRSMLRVVGIEVDDTRAWRLEPLRDAHPLVDALLTWRKADRVATTYGYNWLDANVGPDGRLRGGWTGCDGAAGRMTAQVGLHNLPAELRDAVRAEPGYAFVHADLGQIEPRVLAAVSRDRGLTEATRADDLYAPVAARLRVDRPTAKVAVLAAMYGQTSGTAGEALRGMERAYPVAMALLQEADRSGRAGRDVRTYGGRLVRMWSGASDSNDPQAQRSVAAARGRFARNALIQGAAAELFKAWAVIVRGRVAPLGGRVVLCLHDELLVHVPKANAQEAAAIVSASIAEAAQRWMPGSPVRYVAVASVVECWADAK